MAERVIKLPDVGEGVAEAELVEWNVAVGDLVREDQILAGVMTDKATVEIPSPVDGRVIWIAAEVGTRIAVGSPLVRIETAGEGAAPEPAGAAPAPTASPAPPPVATSAPPPSPASAPRPAAKLVSSPAPIAKTASAPRAAGEKPLASPAVRQRAREAGVDLRQVPGGGPAGRIRHEDLDAFISGRAGPAVLGLAANMSVEQIKIVGLRRRIAERMALAHAKIAHITYVEEIDVTALEDLRAALNKAKRPEQTRLTLLPFLMRAMVKAIADQPNMNAHFDDEAGVLSRHGGVHIGLAAQTPSGLMVPVVHHAEARDIWAMAAEVERLAAAARNGSASRDELTGSTITLTSLGAMGGVATTPIINYPEVAIVGVNKIATRPVWDGAAFQPRKMMNLSSSFDHRVIDGWDAAVFVQKIKALIETPAMLFVEG
jgi:2-oxoisovalerate dehydrogenase E2 component (dihydrolipoyl transacylase)